MSWDEIYQEAYYGDLYELTVEEASLLIYEGLWNLDQASAKEIEDALWADIREGNLKIVRGSLNSFGGQMLNPPILCASDVQDWVERNGLELESNGAWNDYLIGEAELDSILQSKLSAIRALQVSGKSMKEILETKEIKEEHHQDILTYLLSENHRLERELAALSEGKINGKTMDAFYKVVSFMARDAYGYNWQDKKSPLTSEIVVGVSSTLGVSIDDGTVRKVLKRSSQNFPPLSD